MRPVSAALALFLGLFAARDAFACGPFFPNAYLTFGEEAQVLAMPEASFYHELAVAVGQAPEANPRLDPGWGGMWQRTQDADVQDLRDALVQQDLAAESVEQTVAEYAKMRDRMNSDLPLPSVVPPPSSESYGPPAPPKADDSDQAAEPFALAQYEDLLKRLPREFALYVEGADAYRKKDFAKATEVWRGLLKLPEGERQYRSTWAAYMMGKAALNDDPDGAIAMFEQVRAFAAAGFRDSLTLAPESLGWQALAETGEGDLVPAMHHYIDMFLNGPNMNRAVGYTSLRRLCSRALAEPGELAPLAADPLCRRALTAWVVAAPNRKECRRWLETVGALQLPGPVEGGDRLAWAAYEAGDMDGAKQWLEVSDPALPYSRWVQAKLLLRDGKIDEAVAILRDLTRTFPREDSWVLGYESATVPRDIASAELGVLLLGRQDYVNALDSLMQSGYWIDAAYVAERVLTLDELEAYVSRHADHPALAQPPVQDEYWQQRDTSLFTLLKELLARRLVRAGQMDKALAHFAGDLKADAEALKTQLAVAQAAPPAKGWGASVSEFFSGLWGAQPEQVIDRPRAEAFFKAGELVRKKGMELEGTEVEPDWHLYGGAYELDGATKLRDVNPPDASLNPALAQVLSASEDERKRAADSAPVPDKRFHYRYVASDYMWMCAAYSPDNDLLTEQALYWGGVYIKDRDPEAADKFYKALFWRNLNRPFAHEADKLRWFPPNAPK